VARFRPYFADSGAVSIASSSATPALYVASAAGADLDILEVRASVSGSGGTVPSNTSILVQYSIVTGTVGGGAAVTPRPVGQGSTAAQSTWKSGSTALTGLTQGNVLWSCDIPYAAGSFLLEPFQDGFERNVPAGTLGAFYFTAGSAGSGYSVAFRVDFTE